MRLFLDIDDTWEIGNHIDFSIGSTTGLTPGNYAQSTAPRISRNRNYTILA